MKKYLLLLAFLTSVQVFSQDGCEPYGKKVFDLVMNNDSELRNEFIGLIEYQSYVDRLPMEDDKKDIMKEHSPGQISRSREDTKYVVCFWYFNLICEYWYLG